MYVFVILLRNVQFAPHALETIQSSLEFKSTLCPELKISEPFTPSLSSASRPCRGWQEACTEQFTFEFTSQP